jgi:hypothetical protein
MLQKTFHLPYTFKEKVLSTNPYYRHIYICRCSSQPANFCLINIGHQCDRCYWTLLVKPWRGCHWIRIQIWGGVQRGLDLLKCACATTLTYKGKGKAIPLQAWTGPEGSRRLRLPDFKTIGTWRWVRLSALRTGRLYTPGNNPGHQFC